MSTKAQIVTLRGKVQYAKVLGDPVANFAKDGREWKTDFIPLDLKDTKAALKQLNISDRLRIKDGRYDNQPFMSFKQAEYKADGTPNERIKVTDILGKDWPQDKLIGNDSVVDLRFAVIDYGPGKKPGAYIRGLRVLEHVPFEQKVFDDIDQNDPYYEAMLAAQKAAEDAGFKKDFGLSDDLDDDVEDL